MPRSGISPLRALAAWRSLRPVWHTLRVIFQQILNEESGCLSYLIGCSQAGQAAIVDPGRDRVDDYVAMARRKGLTVSDILETHVHADHVSGNQALAAKTGARIHIHPAANAAFAHDPVEHGREIRIGNVALQVLHVPGHTPDSIALLVTDLSRGTEPWFVLTGDTLFVGDVGRPDFGGEQAAASLYASLTERLLRLPDSVEVYPAHGAGSSCGRAMSSKTATTIGFERRFNAALQVPDAEEFVRRLMTGLPPKPPNFDRIIARNRAQALPQNAEPRPLSAAQVRELLDKGACVLDVRSPEEYGEAHVPGALNVWIESPQFANRAGLFIARGGAGGAGGGEPHRSHARDGRPRPHRARRDRRSSAVGDDRVEEPGAAGRPGAADQRARPGHHEGRAARPRGRWTCASCSSGTRATSTAPCTCPWARRWPARTWCRRGGRRRSSARAGCARAS